MQVSGTVYARNAVNGVTIMSSDPRSTQFVQWEAAGDPNGGDIQPVPKELLETPAFVRAIRNGVLTMVDPDANLALDDPESSLNELLDKQRVAWQARQEAANEDIRATIETTENKDMVTLPCVGPSGRGPGTCGDDVTVRETTKHDAPPLCHRHKGLASEYVPTAVGRDPKGNKLVEWTRAGMSERVIQPRD